VPDVREREVYLCGPTPMMEAVRDGLQLLGIPRGHIHFERFEF
jgi:ferredoxin-NADP reductase